MRGPLGPWSIHLEVWRASKFKYNILEPILEQPSKEESKTTVDSKNLVAPLESR